MTTCPIEGCTSPHDSRNGLQNHIANSQDDAHAAYDWEGAGEVIDAMDDDDPPADHTPTTAADGGDDLADDPDGGTTPADESDAHATDPTMDDGPPSTSAGSSTSASPSDEPTCPECGGNRYFDADEIGIEAYAYGCADCTPTPDGKAVVFDA